MNSKKLLILDKDGTLTQTRSGKTFVQYPKDQKIIAGMGKAVAKAKNKGWQIVVASNQGGIGAGYKTHEQTIEEFEYLYQLFPQIRMATCCPDDGFTIIKLDYIFSLASWLNKVDCQWLLKVKHEREIKLDSFRKPGAGMLQYLLAHFEVDRDSDKIIFVGDRPEDEQAATNAGVAFVWADVFNDEHQKFL